MLDKKSKLLLIGGGDFTKKIIRLVSSFHLYDILGYTDMEDKGVLFGVEYLGKDDTIENFLLSHENVDAILCIAGNISLLEKKESLVEFYKGLGCNFPSIISEKAYVDATVKTEEGIIVFDHAYVDFDSSIGRNSIINIDCLIGHDSVIGENCTISPKSIIGGGTRIGNNCFIGINSTVNPYLTICDNVIIGAGSVVPKSIYEKGVYAGNPVKRIK